MAEYITFQPSDYFNTTLYTGNGTAIGSGGNAITGVGFQPDFTWIKQRNATNNHNLQNSAVGATKYVNSDRNIAQVTNAESLTTWGADGFTLGNLGDVNGSGNTFVSWNWKGGTTSGIATNGSTTITPSSYSFNQTAGFSILKYTGNITSGAKLAHGLGATPSMIIIKCLDNADNWAVYNKGMDATAPEDYALMLNVTDARDNSDSYWNDTAPDSVNITLGNGDLTNRAASLIAYCFAEVKGYSSFGSYTGTGDATISPFIYTGFRPAFVVGKRLEGSEDWNMWNDKALGYNVDNNKLYANLTTAEATADEIDLLSNGFTVSYTHLTLPTKA